MMKHPEWTCIEDADLNAVTYRRDYDGFYVEVDGLAKRWSVTISFTENDDEIHFWFTDSLKSGKQEAEAWVQRNYAKIVAEVGSREVYASMVGSL